MRWHRILLAIVISFLIIVVFVAKRATSGPPWLAADNPQRGQGRPTKFIRKALDVVDSNVAALDAAGDLDFSAGLPHEPIALTCSSYQTATLSSWPESDDGCRSNGHQACERTHHTERARYDLALLV